MSDRAIAMEGLLECEYFDFASKSVGDTFRIFVAKPPFLPATVRSPAIYVADGNGGFAMVMSIQRMLAWGAEVPPAHVVALGYPTENGYLQATAKRNRDYAPTDGGELATATSGVAVEPGAPRFLRFLVEELKPHLEGRYGIDGGDSTFFGSSLAGLFGAWTLLTAPSTFQRYVLASPQISWNDEEVWSWEQACADRRTDLTAAVFIGAGEFETAQEGRRNALHIARNNPLLRPRVETMIAWLDEHGWPRTAELALEFAARLRTRGYASLKIHSCQLPGETHMSISPSVVSRGLRYVFDSWQP